MFDTKNYDSECQCPKVFCHHYYPEHPFEVERVTASQHVLYNSAYNKGYYEGRKDLWNEFERERKLLRSATDQEKFAKLLQEAMGPLEDLLKDIK